MPRTVLAPISRCRIVIVVVAGVVVGVVGWRAIAEREAGVAPRFARLRVRVDRHGNEIIEVRSGGGRGRAVPWLPGPRRCWGRLLDGRRGWTDHGEGGEGLQGCAHQIGVHESLPDQARHAPT